MYAHRRKRDFMKKHMAKPRRKPGAGLTSLLKKQEQKIKQQQQVIFQLETDLNKARLDAKLTKLKELLKQHDDLLHFELEPRNVPPVAHDPNNFLKDISDGNFLLKKVVQDVRVDPIQDDFFTAAINGRRQYIADEEDEDSYEWE